MSRFLIVVACAALFVAWTSQSLPPVVASHFGADGAANRVMARGAYMWFMLVFVVALPLFVVGLSHLTLGLPGARINVPHRDYWLAPERRAATVATIRAQMTAFGMLLVVFLCYVHELVVRANATQPVRLSSPWFLGGLVAFLIATLAWTKRLLARFPAPGAGA